MRQPGLSPAFPECHAGRLRPFACAAANGAGSGEGETFVITTPLYYSNAQPHMGSAYPTIACDAIARYQVSPGREAGRWARLGAAPPLLQF